ncbi:GntR family transcriptional regulator [Effusibacillus lacus]|uniref:GntR family transcriptional regulator n=1 Tax=Effusibacillus lacus TaxID=1348429 RepID=A0A292YP09_9BACL|nr:GntR family transcriptional regulator [Effusibacillus lacus]TCS71609.1 GntR family transcriptional regulator [Effusibacillus lacus]GAX90114.1 GntR family transcriptional regulator [Effusibacillus lacus]
MNRQHLRLDDRSTLHERVVSRLREAILKGEFEPGERLVQEELAEAMGVSRMPIREALRQLEKEGLVTLEPHKGAIVTPVTSNDIEEIYYLRAVLEAIAVERSLPNLTQEDKRTLRQLADDMEQAALSEDVEQFVLKNAEFHRIMRKGCGWRRAHMILEMLWHGFPPHTPGILPGQMERSLTEHKEMLELIEKGDAERLQSVIRKHILRTGEAFKEYLNDMK